MEGDLLVQIVGMLNYYEYLFREKGMLRLRRLMTRGIMICDLVFFGSKRNLKDIFFCQV